MKTENAKISCPKCGKSNFVKNGTRKIVKNHCRIQIYKCKDCACRHQFTKNSFQSHYRQRKPYLNTQISTLYCEGTTLRGISRILGISYRTVILKFRNMAKLARERHTKALNNEIKTSLVHFDEIETHIRSKWEPYGIELAIDPESLKIVSAKVCRIPLKSGRASVKEKREKWNSNTNRKKGLEEMLKEIKPTLKKDGSIISDKIYHADKIIPKICPNAKYDKIDSKDMWKINHTCAKLRHHISRLRRKTWALSKIPKGLQDHLDLFIAYQNNYQLA